MLAYGVILVLLVFFLPRGIVPALTDATRRHAASSVGFAGANDWGGSEGAARPPLTRDIGRGAKPPSSE
jgi:hypothetical protein